MNNYNIFSKNKIKENLKSDLKKSLNINVFSELDSTNNEAKRFVNNNIIKTENKLFVFAADVQNKGRGRRGKIWLSNDPASIAVTFLFEIKKDFDKIAQITAAAALAVYETLSFFALNPKIKWPNDILIENKKIAGILSELIFNRNEKSYVLIGCGLNLNNDKFDSEIKDIATSYYLAKKKKIDKNRFLAKLIENIDYYIRFYLEKNRNKIIKEWKNKLSLKNKKIKLDYKNKKHFVYIKDVLDSGELLVVFENGVEKKLKSLNTSLDYQSLE